MDNIANVRIVKDPFARRLIRHPFKFYGRAAGFTFCLVSVTNLCTSLFDGTRRQFLLEHPQLYFTGLVAKSSYFGVVWPAFYFTAATNPRDAFVLGGGIPMHLTY